MSKFHSQSLLLLIPLLTTISEVSGDCRQTFVISCDNLQDYLSYESDAWRQLIIGNTNYAPTEKWSLMSVWHFLTQDLTELEWLTINNQLHDKLNDEVRIDLKHEKLKYLNFYKNNLTNFYPYHFHDFPSLLELNLVDNNIRQIAGGQHSFYSVDKVDLSENRLTEIEDNGLSRMKIRQLIIKSNRLSSIAANTLNGHLEIFNLDHNEFTYIPDDGLENLQNLKVLTMSHNRIALLSKLSYLRQIEKFDFSHNHINSIRTEFQQFPNLRHIDLSHNLIKQINYRTLIPHNGFPIKISIAFNRLTRFRFDANEWMDVANSTATITLILFGNPWICKCLDEMVVLLEEHPFKRAGCDLSLFGDGRFPSCVNQKVCQAANIAFETSFYESFINVLNESRKYFTCNIDMDMLNLEREHRNYAVLGLPTTARRAGNKTIVEF